MDGFINQAYAVYTTSREEIAKNSNQNNVDVFTVSETPSPIYQNGKHQYQEDQQSRKSESETSSELKREKWGKDIEFLMSCIALSVGLGNVWRFPFTALDNGGGAFLIPYLIVLVLVGKPVYYLEMLIGQFSSRSSIKVFDISPIMRGVGYGQVLSTAMATTYYASLMALTIRYFFASFSKILPWSYCKEEWISYCIDSSSDKMHLDNSTDRLSSSAELYFYKEVLKETDSIHNGIGLPDWKLVCCLAFSWTVICLIIIRGVRSSGKISYFLAIFPYIIMILLLIRAVTLPGAIDGILYFITPQWNELLNPKVWYSAVSQVFFSLAICFGNIIMYASFNRFSHNIYRDAVIVTSLDTATSMLAGIIIFGILGNLAYESGNTDIKAVVEGGAGLAFVSYPDAIAKMDFIPQAFAVLFFFMLFILGIGSNVGMASCVMTSIRDRFTKLVHWKVALAVTCVQFLIGLVYLTPGGQYILNLVDFFGASFVAFVLGIAELVTFAWIYGVNRLCLDIEFMLGIKTGWYWRICWSIITPGLMAAILVYHMATWEPLTYKNYVYPDVAYGIGWLISAIGIAQLPIWALYAVYKQKGIGFREKLYGSFKPTSDWGPLDPLTRKRYIEFLSDRQNIMFKKNGIWNKIKDNIFG